VLSKSRPLSPTRSSPPSLNGFASSVSRNAFACSTLLSPASSPFPSSATAPRAVGNNVLYSIADPVVFKLCRLVCRASSEHDERQATALRKAAQSFQKK
jgi:hypothetical protein